MIRFTSSSKPRSCVQRLSFWIVQALLLVPIFQDSRLSFANGIPHCSATKGSLASVVFSALSTRSHAIVTGSATKRNFVTSVSTALSVGSWILSKEDLVVEASDFGLCRSTNNNGLLCGTQSAITYGGYTCQPSDYNCCNTNIDGSGGESDQDNTCNSSSKTSFGCCSCNGNENTCESSKESKIYDGSCNGNSACQNSPQITVYSGSCNNSSSCVNSQALTVGSGSCNGEYSCANCCTVQGSIDCAAAYSGLSIPDNECNEPGNSTTSRSSCSWCPGCQTATGKDCYNELLGGKATLVDPYTRRLTTSTALDVRQPNDTQSFGDKTKSLERTLKKRKASKKAKTNCISGMNKLVTYFQTQAKDVKKLRTKYTEVTFAKGVKKGNGKGKGECDFEIQWVFEHLDGDEERLQACNELEAHIPKLEIFLGQEWSLKDLKCFPENKHALRF